MNKLSNLGCKKFNLLDIGLGIDIALVHLRPKDITDYRETDKEQTEIYKINFIGC